MKGKKQIRAEIALHEAFIRLCEYEMSHPDMYTAAERTESAIQKREALAKIESLQWVIGEVTYKYE